MDFVAFQAKDAEKGPLLSFYSAWCLGLLVASPQLFHGNHYIRCLDNNGDFLSLGQLQVFC